MEVASRGEVKREVWAWGLGFRVFRVFRVDRVDRVDRV